MPLKDRPQRKLPRLGVIRLGKKVKRQVRDGKTNTIREVEFPTQTDYFVLDDAPELLAFYHAQGQDKVRELDVLLPFTEIAKNYDAFYQVWAGGVLVCQGDGEMVQYATPHRVEVKQRKDKQGQVIGETTHVYNVEGDTLVSNGLAQVSFDWNSVHFGPGDTVDCPGPVRADLYPHCKVCKLSGILKVMMAHPQLFRFGYYQLTTGSGRNYDTILGVLETLPPIALEKKIPFKLRLVEEPTTYRDERGQRHQTTRWFLQLEPDPDLMRKLYARMAESLIEDSSHSPLLPAPVVREAYDAEPPLPPPYAREQGEDTPRVSAPLEPGEVLVDEDGELSSLPDSSPIVPSRPFSPLYLKEQFALWCESDPNEPANERQQGLLWLKAQECFAGLEDAQKRADAVLHWLLPQREELSSMTKAEATAVLRWLLRGGQDSGGDYTLHPMAAKEASAIYDAALVDAGQMSLPW